MSRFNPPLQVVGFVATRLDEPERGPAIRLNTDDARLRLISDGELVWVYGPRRHELAVAIVDDAVKNGQIVVRDIAGLAVSEIVRLVRVAEERPVLHKRSLT